MLMDQTAAELATALDVMQDFPHDTGGVAVLDEATVAFGRKSTEIAEANAAFTDARRAHQRSYVNGGYSEDAWQGVLDAARRLSAALRILGGMRIARCKEQCSWGPCNLPLDDQGKCHSFADHRPDR